MMIVTIGALVGREKMREVRKAVADANRKKKRKNKIFS